MHEPFQPLDPALGNFRSMDPKTSPSMRVALRSPSTLRDGPRRITSRPHLQRSVDFSSKGLGNQICMLLAAYCFGMFWVFDHLLPLISTGDVTRTGFHFVFVCALAGSTSIRALAVLEQSFIPRHGTVFVFRII